MKQIDGRGLSKAEKVKQVEVRLVPLVEILKRERQRKRITLATLARRAHVSVEAIKELESYNVNAVGLMDLLSIGAALGANLTVALAPIRPNLPSDNTEILREFDQLIKSSDCNPFIRKAPDNDHKSVQWDIVGDRKRNWLFVVASNPKKGVRFAAVTDEPGGWAIGGQIFGIDGETNQIADRLAEKLLQEHRAELV